MCRITTVNIFKQPKIKFVCIWYSQNITIQVFMSGFQWSTQPVEKTLIVYSSDSENMQYFFQHKVLLHLHSKLAPGLFSKTMFCFCYQSLKPCPLGVKHTLPSHIFSSCLYITLWRFKSLWWDTFVGLFEITIKLREKFSHPGFIMASV